MSAAFSDMVGHFLRWIALAIMVTGASCTSVMPIARAPSDQTPTVVRGQIAPGGPPIPVTAPNVAGPIANPIFVAANSSNPDSDLFVTERAADLLARYNFEIDTANQLEGTIATQYKVGSGILEPWHRESVGCANRWESTFQPIRRKVLVHYVRVEGGYLVSIEALKEIEDLASPTPNSPGSSSFQQNYPLRRDLNPVLGQASPSGWLPLGRDLALEQQMLCQLQAAYAAR